MMGGMSFSEMITVLERTEFHQASDDGTGTNLLSSDVQEERIKIPLVLYLSDNSGVANTVTISKVEEDDTTTTIINNLNLTGNENVILSIFDEGVPLPRLEGGTNLEVNANADGVDATLISVNNVQ